MKAEDKKLILEWCGLEKQYMVGKFQGWKYPELPPAGNGMCYGAPEPILDMNFYFKYAVPKLSGASMSYANGARFLWILEYGADNRTESFSLDPAEAFGAALLKLILSETKDVPK